MGKHASAETGNTQEQTTRQDDPDTYFALNTKSTRILEDPETGAVWSSPGPSAESRLVPEGMLLYENQVVLNDDGSTAMKPYVTGYVGLDHRRHEMPQGELPPIVRKRMALSLADTALQRSEGSRSPISGYERNGAYVVTDMPTSHASQDRMRGTKGKTSFGFTPGHRAATNGEGKFNPHATRGRRHRTK